MKVTIRNGVWETNSSSVHSLTICTKEEYDKWRKGDLWYDWGKETITDDPINKWNEDNYGFERFWEEVEHYEDTFEEFYTTPSGDEIVVFGYSGHDW